MPTDRPLHIAVVSRTVAPQHGHGGLERAAAHHLRHLARRGVRLTVFTQPPHPGAPPPEAFGGAVTWREVPYRTAPLPLRRNGIPDRLVHYGAFVRRAGREIAALARRERVDAVHGHGLGAAGYARLLREGPDGALPPLVLNPHGLEEFSRAHPAKFAASAPFRRGVRLAAAAAARVVSTDHALDGAVARLLRVPPEKVATIPNGVDLAELDALVRPERVRAVRERFGLDGAPLTLVTVARLERNKGLREGLAALAAARDDLPAGWRWTVVGAGSERDALARAIETAGLGSNVTLAGALPDEEVQNLLAAADLLLVPSLYEGSSLVALEGLARGLAVVATTAGGLPDKVRPGETGFLAPPGDVAELRAALLAALAARDAWPDYGARGRRLVAACFDWTRLVERYLELYEAVKRESVERGA
ncbi:MAG TPA: glycosyltransferase family 4 protein [Thermomicrobiales bacterium]|nr:glycosyltransferase family 4 protein [Thermomicrobiales bacterium]